MEKLLGYLQATAARSRGGEERERLLLLVLDGGVAVESRSRQCRRRRVQVVGTSIQKVAAPSVRAGRQGAARMETLQNRVTYWAVAGPGVCFWARPYP